MDGQKRQGSVKMGPYRAKKAQPDRLGFFGLALTKSQKDGALPPSGDAERQRKAMEGRGKVPGAVRVCECLVQRAGQFTPLLRGTGGIGKLGVH